ncbi:carbamoyltransferase C-terminal domain-containing protein [Saccharicrinis sp. FJH54]|uniref:carbamoyltransferase C-terminal domain-containing protein n=1 Tax=Saccharicrinis sp. FJH54 TaxID=3344665 RepID=UPI0035D4AE10
MGKPTVAVYAIPDCYPEGTIAFAHDHAIAVMQDGQLLNYLHLERKTRIKRDNRLQDHLYDLLKDAGLLKQEFDLVSVDSVQGRSFITADGRIRVEAGPVNQLYNGMEKVGCWFLDRPKKAFLLNHELAHLYSGIPFYGAFKENSLLVHFDGGASKSNFSAWHYVSGSLNPVEAHWELKQLSSLFNANALTFSIIGAGFKDQHSVPGKFMGFAGFGEPDDTILAFLKHHHFFQNYWDKPSCFLRASEKEFGIKLNGYDQHHAYIQNVAATIHEYWVQTLMKKFRALKLKTGADHLYYAGGAALNIVANSRLVDSGLFNSVHIPPCTDDSGLVLGAAAYMEMQKGHTIQIASPYINSWGTESYKTELNTETIQLIAAFIAEGKVIGVCNNFGECGPRALGNRSIIARADDRELAQKVSCEMKQREWYRPVAPIMLADNVLYFTGKPAVEQMRYMLYDAPVTHHKTELDGATHVDGTARIQALFNYDDNPWMYELLRVLDQQFNIKALINTSFNQRGEPIVHTEKDAFRSARAMQLDGLVVNGTLQLIK